ncbi:MAG: hypothetical protein SFW67_09965 [Myxococcaceae bacterium]|nr:hypothetical protein [Myxococcaceae bacterium]
MKTDAVDKARDLLETGGTPRTKTVPGGIITNDTASVNDPKDVKKSQRSTEAKAQLLDNATLEGDALLGLSPKDRERYQKVKETLLTPAPGKPHGDPVAALALQTMLLEGKLPGAKALGSKDTLLGGLEKLATQEVGQGIDRQALLADVVQEVCSPSAVSQSTKRTCSVTTAQIQLMRDNPAEYVRLVSGLASPAGEVRTVGGDVLKVQAGALTDSTTRSLSQRLLAPALMELGNGQADYQNGTDEHVGGELDGKGGLHTGQVDRVLESLTGKAHQWTTQGTTDEKHRHLVATVDAQLKAGKSLMVGLEWVSEGHHVLVVGTEQRADGEYVKIINPHGTEESIPRAEFDARLISANYRS